MNNKNKISKKVEGIESLSKTCFKILPLKLSMSEARVWSKYQESLKEEVP